MLSFLREQTLDEPIETQGGDSPGQDGEYYTVASHGKKARKSTTLLAILFVIGLACLGVMIKRSTPKAASAAEADAEQTDIQLAIARITGVKTEMFNRMGEIVNKFYEFSGVKQVEVGELATNPFEFKLVPASVKAELDTEPRVSPLDAEGLRRRQMAQQAKDLEVLSIMQSTQGNCCMIGDKFLYEGDTIQNFRVVEIKENQVRLLWVDASATDQDKSKLEDLEIVLKLTEE
jgi:hypothetical protein